MNATTNQADPWKRPNRDDQWSRVDYRSRAAAAICVIATTLRRRRQRRLSGKGI